MSFSYSPVTFGLVSIFHINLLIARVAVRYAFGAGALLRSVTTVFHLFRLLRFMLTVRPVWGAWAVYLMFAHLFFECAHDGEWYGPNGTRKTYIARDDGARILRVKLRTKFARNVSQAFALVVAHCCCCWSQRNAAGCRYQSTIPRVPLWPTSSDCE